MTQLFWSDYTHNQTHPRSYGHVYFVQVWCRLVNHCRCQSENKVKYSNFSNSRANNSGRSGPMRPIIELIRDLMVIYILSKFGSDWLIFVDARV